MSEIRISPTVQTLGLLTLIGLTVAAVAAQLPEIRRYLNIKSM